MDIVLKKVCKSYDNEIILKDYDYVFKENQITSIKGKSGSGKTTLLRRKFISSKNIFGHSRPIRMDSSHYCNKHLVPKNIFKDY